MTLPPVILTVAPNGAYKTKKDHSGLPLSPTEIAQEARACEQAGAAMIHLHVRDAQGKHSLEEKPYRQAIAAIREAVGENLLIQVTSESGRVFAPAQQRNAIRALQPDAASLALRELAGDDQEAAETGKLLDEMIQGDALPQLILYEASELERYRSLQQRGLLPNLEFPLLFVLGRYTTGQQSSPEDLLPFLASEFIGDCLWSVCAFGPREFQCVLGAALLGGHIRVGFENNLNLMDGSRAENNAALVQQISDRLSLTGRTIANAQQCREMLKARVPG